MESPRDAAGSQDEQVADVLDRSPTGPWLPSRRSVLKGGVLLAVGVAGLQLMPVRRLALALPPDFAPLPPGPDLVREVHRREDLLSLRFEFFNLELDDSGSTASLVRKRPWDAAYIAVVFPPQALAERAFRQQATDGELGHGHEDNVPSTDSLSAPLAASERAWAQESRLAFAVPPEVTSIPYTLEALLDWSMWEPRLVPVASGVPDPQPPGQGPFFTTGLPGIRGPNQFETSIELPWRLMLSPPPEGGWAHATGLVTKGGRTEVWHTRLGVRDGGTVDEWEQDGRTVRAVWTPDRINPYEPFLTSLSPQDRIDIVDATSLYTEGGVPVPADVRRLMLTPLGGWLDVRGAWEPGAGNDLEEWRHLATMGRDHYVRVVRRGYLFPYGHRASLVKITERRFEPYDGAFPPSLTGQQGAFLRQRVFLLVREPVRRYAASGAPGAGFAQPHEGRGWPFATLRFTTLATPILDAPDDAAPAVGDAFVAEVGGEAFLFQVIGQDREGRQVDFTTPVVFVPGEVAFAPGGDVAGLVTSFNGLGEEHVLRRRDMGGQKLALAEHDQPADTALDVGVFVVGAIQPDGEVPASELEARDQPRFYPTLDVFEARMSAAEQASGTDLGVPRFTLGPYVEEGFGAGNDGKVFAVTVDDGVGVGFDADRAGGLVTPNVDVSTLSRTLGAVGGSPAEIQAGRFDPKDVFAAGVARLLGGIDLADIIELADIASEPDKAMRITTRPEFGDGDAQPPTAMVTELEWDPDLQPDPLGLFDPWSTELPDPDPVDATLHIEAVFHQDLADPEASTYDIEGDLRHFRLNLVGSGPATFMIVTFDHLRFTARTGEKTDIDVGIDSVAFAGPLQFVNEIRDYLTFGGSGPFIDLQPSGVTAGYELALPQIPLGMLMFNNIAMSAALHIPFSGDPARIRFGLSSRENPFDVTYSAIGGGGYFGIAFGLDGLERFECAVELGAYLSMDFGVASGQVNIAAGVNLMVEIVGGDTGIELVAYIRFFGKVVVLGLVGVSLEIYIGLGFEAPPPKLVGRASAELTVEVLFFSGSVKVEIERKISATEGDPTFADLFDEEHWEQYAAAFA